MLSTAYLPQAYMSQIKQTSRKAGFREVKNHAESASLACLPQVQEQVVAVKNTLTGQPTSTCRVVAVFTRDGLQIDSHRGVLVLHAFTF
jgi:hypothetical protein